MEDSIAVTSMDADTPLKGHAMTSWKILFVVLVLCATARANAVGKALHATHVVESSNGHNKHDGDHGRAIGDWQIWYSHWKDAVDFDPSIGGCYQDCRHKSYAAKIVVAYWKRYCPEAIKSGDIKTLALVHHGGPDMSARDNALYWKRIQRALK